MINSIQFPTKFRFFVFLFYQEVNLYVKFCIVDQIYYSNADGSRPLRQ